MKKNVSKEVLVVCPFFKHTDGNHIVCEGLYGGTTLSINFGDPNDKESYKDAYCRNMDGYHYCRVCVMLEDKYNDGK